MHFVFVRQTIITHDGFEPVKMNIFFFFQQGTSDLVVHPFGKVRFSSQDRSQYN